MNVIVNAASGFMGLFDVGADNNRTESTVTAYLNEYDHRPDRTGEDQ